MIPAILLFVSGAAALVFQTLWVKQLGLVVGVDVYAVTIAVSAFFVGLAIGGAIIGRWADRTPRPFALYARLEIGVAALGVCATLALARADRLFVTLETIAGPFAWTVPFLAVVLPAFLMGGTLPVLVRALHPDDAAVGRASGLLYAANTAGAVVGALATPFLLVPALGIRGSAFVAGGMNVALAAFAWLVSRPQGRRVADSDTPPAVRRDARFARILYALAGGVALGYEVVWTQAIVPFLSTRVYAFAIVLAVYLTGLVVGSWLYGRMADRVGRPWLIFGLLVSGAGASALAMFACLGDWLLHVQSALANAVQGAGGNRMLMMAARFAVPSVIMILVPTTLLGAAFPAAMRLAGQATRIGRDLGTVVALNTAGGIAGTFVAGVLLVPMLGVVRAMGALAGAAAVIGGIAMVRDHAPRRFSVTIAAVVLAFVLLTVAVTPRDKFARLLAARHGGALIFYEESLAGTVAVLEQEASSTFRRLYIQGVSNSGDTIPSRRYMRLAALLPLAIHKGEPRSALVIGMGTGITAGALLTVPSLDRRVCAELLPAVVQAANCFEGNYDAARDPRIELRITDGRHELLRREQRYDLITLEPPPPSAAGVVNLYSRDFYLLCGDRLADGGLMAQWLPLAAQNHEDSQSLVRSVLDVFPHVTLWTTELHETLLVCSMNPIELDVARIAERIAQAEIAAALGEVGVESAVALLATYVTDKGGLERFAADALPVTDDEPRIECAPWVRDGEFARVLERVATLRSPPPLVGDGSVRSAVERERQQLWAFYRSAHYALTGESDRWESLMKRLAPHVGSNPYYQWFIGR